MPSASQMNVGSNTTPSRRWMPTSSKLLSTVRWILLNCTFVVWKNSALISSIVQKGIGSMLKAFFMESS